MAANAARVSARLLPGWPEGDDRHSRLVFITRNVSEAYVRKILKSMGLA